MPRTVAVGSRLLEGLPGPGGVTAGARPARARTLRERFDPRRNSLSLMRLALATTVALVHAQEIGWQDQPALGRAQIGDMAVDSFFVISGFLVTRSATRLPTLRRFVWHRALRILPGFWTCLLVSALVVAPLLALLQGRSAGSVFTGPDSAVGYVTRNAALLVRQWDITGLAAGPVGGAMNGALWTLFYEALCYLAIGALVGVGLVKARRAGRYRIGHALAALRPERALPARIRGHAADAGRRLRHHTLLATTLAVWLCYLGQRTAVLPASPDFVLRFLWMFLLGALGHVYAHRIRFTPVALALGAATFLAAAVSLQAYQVAGGPGLAYLLLWAVVALPLRWEPPMDLSYGMYVYHWPVELVLAGLGLAGAGRVPFTATAVVVVGSLAALSWHTVEAPALRRKNAAWVDRPLRLRPAAAPSGRHRRGRPPAGTPRQPAGTPRQPAGTTRQPAGTLDKRFTDG